MFPLLLLIAAITFTQISCQRYNGYPTQDVLRRPARDAPYCSYRCSRIYQRSLNRMNENLESVQYLFERLGPAEDIRNACWKSFDFLDCMEHCELQNRQRLGVIRNVIEDRCRNFMKGSEANLACISKYHTFIEVRCSSYMSEAIQHSRFGERESVQQSCRYLYYHSLCLVNNMNNYCPNSARLFTHDNLRDYFLSFLLPADDRQVSDDFLDECQIYNFASATKGSFPPPKDSDAPLTTTASTTTEAIVVTHPDEQVNVTMVSHVAETITSAEESSTKAKAAFKKLFSPDEDLMDEPPNFFYSSLRSMSRGKKRPAEVLYSEQRSGSNDDVDFVTLPKSGEKNVPELHAVETVDKKSLENIHRVVHVNIFDPETIVTPSDLVTSKPDDGTAIIWTHPSHDAALPTMPAAEATMPTLPSFLPLTTNTASTASTKTIPSTTAALNASTSSSAAASISFPATDHPPEPEVTKTENYAIRHPTKQKLAIVNSEETAKIMLKQSADDVEHVKILPTDSTGDEYFMHLIHPDQTIRPTAIEPTWRDELPMKPVKVSRPEDGISIEISPFGEVIYVHDNDPQVDDQASTTKGTVISATTTPIINRDSITTIGTATTQLPVLSKIQTTATAPQQSSYFPAPSSSASSSLATPDFVDLLDQMDVQANMPSLSDASNASAKHRTTPGPRSLESSASRPPLATAAAAKAITVYKIFQNIPKTKIYKIFPLPTITTDQKLVFESVRPQTAATDPSTRSSKEVFYEMKLTSTVVDEALSGSTTDLKTIMPTVVPDKKPIKSFDESSQVVHRGRQNETTEFEVTEPSPAAVFEKTVISADSAGPEMKGTNESHDLLFIYEVLVFVSFLAAAVLLATVVLRR